MIASTKVGTNNWKYIEYKTDDQYSQLLKTIYPSEVLALIDILK